MNHSDIADSEERRGMWQVLYSGSTFRRVASDVPSLVKTTNPFGKGDGDAEHSIPPGCGLIQHEVHPDLERPETTPFKRSSVYAYKAEIDSWWRSRRAALDAVPPIEVPRNSHLSDWGLPQSFWSS
jgi:hypothetical protein